MINFWDNNKKPHKCTVYVVDFKRKRATHKLEITEEQPLTEYSKQKVERLAIEVNQPKKMGFF